MAGKFRPLTKLVNIVEEFVAAAGGEVAMAIKAACTFVPAAERPELEAAVKVAEVVLEDVDAGLSGAPASPGVVPVAGPSVSSVAN